MPTGDCHDWLDWTTVIADVDRAHLRDAEGDPSLALREAVRDGLAERRRARLSEALQARAISHGYVRG